MSPEGGGLPWSAQELAYIGDAVYELYVRRRLLTESPPTRPRVLHQHAVNLVRGEAQVKALRRIESRLTPEERDIVRRGRNAASGSSQGAVRAYSTGFEALVGFLYLTGQRERLQELLREALPPNLHEALQEESAAGEMGESAPPGRAAGSRGKEG